MRGIRVLAAVAVFISSNAAASWVIGSGRDKSAAAGLLVLGIGIFSTTWFWLSSLLRGPTAEDDSLTLGEHALGQMKASDEPTGTGRRLGHHDLGVVVVHGIANRNPGRTAHQYARGVASYLESYCDRATVVDLRHDELTTSICVLGDGGLPRTWVFQEAHWGDVPPRPRIRSVIAWLTLVVPWVLQTDAIWYLKRHGWTDEDSRSFRRSPTLWNYYIIRTNVMGAVSVIAQAAVVVLGVPAALLSRRARDRIVRVGDAFAYVTRPSTRAAMTERIHATVEDLSLACDNTVILAHSQGAALTAGYTATYPRTPVRSILAFGSGLAKLEGLRTARATRGLLPFSALARVALIALYLIAISNSRFEEAGIPGLTILLFLLLGWLSAKGVRQAVIEKVERMTATPKWTNIYANHDPVAAGTIRVNGQPWGRGVTVSNSILFDHVRYHASPGPLYELVSFLESAQPDKDPVVPDVGVGLSVEAYVLQAERLAVRQAGMWGIGVLATIGIAMLRAFNLVEWTNTTANWIALCSYTSLSAVWLATCWRWNRRSARCVEERTRSKRAPFGVIILSPVVMNVFLLRWAFVWRQMGAELTKTWTSVAPHLHPGEISDFRERSHVGRRVLRRLVLATTAPPIAEEPPSSWPPPSPPS